MKRLVWLFSILIVASMLLAACGGTPETVEKIVEKTVVETVIVEIESSPEVIEQVVKETVIVEGTPEVVERVITDNASAARADRRGGHLQIWRHAHPAHRRHGAV